VESYVALVEAKLEMENLRGKDADWSFNFFQVNCGILGGRDSELAESIKRLFGVSGDSYTALPGLFQICSYVGGTLFLDEIADAPIRIQDNLLRPLEEGKVSRPGWETFDEAVKNVRVIGATFKDLFSLARQYQETLSTGNPNGFRPDLLTRLTRNTPVPVVPVWHYFVPKSPFENGDYPHQFAYVLKEAFKVDMPFWRDVYRRVSNRLDVRDRMSTDIMPDKINRRRHFASKLSMRLFKQVGHLASKGSEKDADGLTKYSEDAKHYALNEYLPRMLDYLFSG
jgi:hypothetical protein